MGMNILFDKIRGNLPISNIFNILNDGVIYEDEEGRIIFANLKYCQLIGLDSSDIIGKPSSDFVFPEDRQVYHKKTLSRRHIQKEAHPIRLQDFQGNTLDTLISVQAVFDEQNKYAGNLAVVTDVSPLHEQTRALEESENKFKTLLAASNEGIFIHENYILLEANKRFYEMHGYEPHELLGKPLNFLLLTDEAYRITSKNIQNKFEGAVEFNSVHKNGTLIPVVCSARNGTYNGRQVRIVSLQDLSKLKKREHQLAETVERYNALSRLSGTFTWEVDADGLYTYLSDTVEQVTGYRMEELLHQKYFYDIHPDQGRDEFKATALETFSRKQAFQGLENPIQTKDRSIVYVCTSGFPMLAADGTLLGYRGSDTDITELQQMRLKLLDFHARLSHTERLAGLGTMVATMCHEINQPLTTMKLTMQELQHRLEQSHGTVSQDMIVHNIRHVLDDITTCISILQEYRTFSRLNTPTETIRVDPFQLFDNLIKVFKAQCRKNNVMIQLDGSVYECKPFYTLCDLEQVAFILLHNAIDASIATNAHQISVHLECENDRLLLSISDQGHGISPADREKIFEPFFTTKPRDKGTGLGLSIVKRILNNCDGDIQCTSEPEQGTTFSVTIPISDSNIKDNRNASA